MQSRLDIYNLLRQAHASIKDIEDRTDEWEQNVIDTVAGVLYMAESEFARERCEQSEGKVVAIRPNPDKDSLFSELVTIQYPGPRINSIYNDHGNEWDAFCAECGERTMQIMRPGKAQCSNCG